jgi:hypothetical protein
MATYTGHQGVVKIGSTAVAEVKDFSLEITANTVDATVLGAAAADQGWTKSKIVNRSWTATINCFYDDAATNGQIEMQNNIMQSVDLLLADTVVTLNLYNEGDSTGKSYWQGDAMITSLSETVSGDGLVEISFTATGNGHISVETA